jgi:heavy metal sensor kinase
MALSLVELEQTAWRLTGAGGIVLALGLIGGWWLATRAISPIQSISATAGKIAAGDLSQRIQAEERESELGRLVGVLNSTFAQLEAAFVQQGRFTSDAAHELRTPVTVLLTRIQTTLAQRREVGQYQETLEICQRTVQRMRRLIESLLQLARLDSGQESMKRERFDLTRMIEENVELVQPLASNGKICIHQSGTKVLYTGDRDRLAQVVSNLLSNAIEYNRPHGEIWVEAGATDDSIVITVEDNGMGIRERDLPHLFTRFYRADPSRTSDRGRTGLGLAISKAIVEAHGGHIEVVSSLGQGSTFTVRLPCASGLSLTAQEST